MLSEKQSSEQPSRFARLTVRFANNPSKLEYYNIDLFDNNRTLSESYNRMEKIVSELPMCEGVYFRIVDIDDELRLEAFNSAHICYMSIKKLNLHL